MIQVTDAMCKPNPHSLNLFFIVAVSRLDKPSVKELPRHGKGVPLMASIKAQVCVQDFAEPLRDQYRGQSVPAKAG
jgi:hypothetical protein